jgi:DNA invertase Pin-like site-specific DNA recombinase
VKRAAGYVRVSQVGGREGDSFLSPEVQREKIKAWAAYRGYTLETWYTDMDVSGRRGTVRPQFERMMADAARSAFDVVAVYRLTRFGRSVSEAARRYEELEKLGVDLVSVTEDIDTTSAGGRFMRNVLLSMAEFESERIGEEWRNVHAARRRRGLVHVPRGVYGYRVEENGAAIASVDDEAAEHVRLIFRRRLAGDGYGTIAAELERLGVPSPKGRPRWARATLAKVLRNPIYAGLVRAGDELVPGAHRAIVTREEFEAVQALAGQANDRARFRSSLLSGLLVCDGCGFRMKMERRSDRTPRYRCTARSLSRRCPAQVTILAEAVEQYVEQEFLRRFDPARMPRGGTIRRAAADTKRAERLRAEADKLTAALDDAAHATFVTRTMPRPEYDRQATPWTEERDRLLAEAAALEAKAVVASVPPEIGALDAWPGLRVEAKRRALRRLIDEVRVSRARRPGDRDVRGRVKIHWHR